MNYPARRLRVETEQAAPKPKAGPEGLTIRQWAVHAVDFALDDWEKANGNLPKTSAQWKEYPFFFMRWMKCHPKLTHAKPHVAADVFVSLWSNVDEVQDVLLRDDMGVDDIHAYVTRRWESISHLPGESPLKHALNVTKTTPLVFGVPSKYLDQCRYGTVSRLTDEAKESQLTEVTFEWKELCTTKWGLFLGVVLNLDKMLRKANPKPSLILSCDQLAEVLEVNSKTAWDYRCRLSTRNVIKKLPKQGVADRFEVIHPNFECFLYWTWKYDPTKGNVGRHDRIDID